jgi:hypothetical protein
MWNGRKGACDALGRVEWGMIVTANLLAQLQFDDEFRPREDGIDWVMWLFVAVFVAIVWWATRPRRGFSIRIDGEAATFRGIAESRQQRIKQFLLQECGIAGPLRIDGGKSRAGRLWLRFSGEIDPGTRQRIRNFLLTQI